MNELSIEKVNNDIIKLRRLNIKIDIVNNHIKNLLEKTNIFIRGFGKINIDKTINEIAEEQYKTASFNETVMAMHNDSLNINQFLAPYYPISSLHDK
jgi:hypothetical protein